MSELLSPGHAELAEHNGDSLLRISGDWTLRDYRALSVQIESLRTRLNSQTLIDVAGLNALDTAGASLLYELLGTERLRSLDEDNSALPAERRALLAAVGAAMGQCPPTAKTKHHFAIADMFEHIGDGVVALGRNALGLLGFIGLTLESAVKILFLPHRWRITSLVSNLEKTAFDAVPIIALLTFLVGAVVAFLGATVLTDFGAGIFTVNLVAFSFLREFGALLTAILVAGRTSSAFAAQIGSMRANEEVDAIRVMGLSPIELLVLPRVWALCLALPLLTFIAMASGIIGGMLVCYVTLDISPTMFISIFEKDVAIRHFIVGIAKAPIFAFLIAVIGCLEGFKVSGSAQSVGEHTTSAVVQSIFVVIVVDAAAALFYMEMGW